jgi:hypothetical protein
VIWSQKPVELAGASIVNRWLNVVCVDCWMGNVVVVGDDVGEVGITIVDVARLWLLK